MAAAVTILLGDSQGQALRPHLASCRPGLVVDVHQGRTVAQLRKAAAELPAATRAAAGTVWVTGGGNDGATPDTVAARALVDLFPAGSVVWVAPPPATTIANLAHAKAVFGGAVKSAGHWHATGRAAERERGAQLLEQAVRGYRGARWLDPRNVAAPYPPQPDGIHMAGQTAQAVAAALCRGEPKPGVGIWIGMGLGVLGLGIVAAVIRRVRGA